MCIVWRAGIVKEKGDNKNVEIFGESWKSAMLLLLCSLCWIMDDKRLTFNFTWEETVPMGPLVKDKI